MAKGYTLSSENRLKNLEPLRFSADGKFKNLHLTDIHKVHPDMDDDEDRAVPENKSLNTAEDLSPFTKTADLRRKPLSSNKNTSELR